METLSGTAKISRASANQGFIQPANKEYFPFKIQIIQICMTPTQL